MTLFVCLFFFKFTLYTSNRTVSDINVEGTQILIGFCLLKFRAANALLAWDNNLVARQ